MRSQALRQLLYGMASGERKVNRCIHNKISSIVEGVYISRVEQGTHESSCQKFRVRTLATSELSQLTRSDESVGSRFAVLPWQNNERPLADLAQRRSKAGQTS